MDSETHAVRREPTGDHERSRIEEKMASSNRYVCTVLEESRESLDRLNWFTLPVVKRHLLALVEEIQTLVNRMEAALYDKHDYEEVREECKKTEAKLEKLTEEKKNLAKEKKALKLQTKALKGKVQSLEARLEELKEVIESKVPNYLEIYLNSTNGALAEEDDSNVEVSQ
jgi:chromosome segregation ATPase